MTYIIQVFGSARDGLYPPEAPSQYFESGDVEAHGGLGKAKLTNYVDQAKKFDRAEEAFEFWQTQSKQTPLRQDGKPNRPFTTFSIMVVEYESLTESVQ